MNARYFIDTNIFVYSFDDRQPEKIERSLALIQEALQTGMGMISTQVIQEFLNLATRKFEVPMKIESARAYQGGCDFLYSEDLQDGQEVRGVKIVNPYR